MTVIFSLWIYSQLESLRTALAINVLAFYDSDTCDLESGDIMSFANSYKLLPVSYLYSAKRLQLSGRCGTAVLPASGGELKYCIRLTVPSLQIYLKMLF